MWGITLVFFCAIAFAVWYGGQHFPNCPESEECEEGFTKESVRNLLENKVVQEEGVEWFFEKEHSDDWRLWFCAEYKEAEPCQEVTYPNEVFCQYDVTERGYGLKPCFYQFTWDERCLDNNLNTTQRWCSNWELIEETD